MRARMLSVALLVVACVCGALAWFVFRAPQEGPAYARVATVTTPLGLKAYLVSDDTLPVVSMKVLFQAGSIYDPADRRGTANLLSTLFDEGAGDMDALAFQSRLEDLAVSLDFSVNRDNLSVSLRTTTDTLDEAFEMLRLALCEPRLDPDAIERMRAAILASIRLDSGDPSSIATNALFGKVFGTHPYAFDEKGTDESVRSLGRDDLLAFLKARVSRENLAIGVAGDISAGQLAVLLDRTFGPLPETASGPEVPAPQPVFDGSVTRVPFNVPQSTALLMQPGLLRPDPDWHAFYLLNYVMGGGGFNSRLMEEVREKRGLAYSVYSALYPFDKVGVWLVGTATENSGMPRSLLVIKEEWTRMATSGPTARELEDAKTYLTGAWPLSFTSTGSVASMLASMRLLDLPPDYIVKRNDIVSGLTLEDLERVRKRVMDPALLTGVVVGP
ncbi:insulinase family protein [Phaeovibrio sulfidiphilus]|uniref:Insulinase family protein n=1 Tax=Phaeovibrio sulfidiphilus TaxID=1220600 RepID=A0A8J7CRU3_9PROT|nr:pitrilysin family protein [Phaeovibrio sulfidiphilus]MBE1237815.1 insulinase family protein [Phaeovibrio sulfidiphilus]